MSEPLKPPIAPPRPKRKYKKKLLEEQAKMMGQNSTNSTKNQAAKDSCQSRNESPDQFEHQHYQREHLYESIEDDDFVDPPPAPIGTEGEELDCGTAIILSPANHSLGSSPGESVDDQFHAKNHGKRKKFKISAEKPDDLVSHEVNNSDDNLNTLLEEVSKEQQDIPVEEVVFDEEGYDVEEPLYDDWDEDDTNVVPNNLEFNGSLVQDGQNGDIFVTQTQSPVENRPKSSRRRTFLDRLRGKKSRAGKATSSSSMNDLDVTSTSDGFIVTNTMATQVALDEKLLDSTLIPKHIRLCCKYLWCHRCLSEEGLFRIPGSKTEVLKLYSDIDTGQVTSLDHVLEPHTICGLMKHSLKTLSLPLGSENTSALNIIISMSSSDIFDCADQIRNFLSTLDPAQAATLRIVIQLFRKIVEWDGNLMNLNNIGTAAGPTLFPGIPVQRCTALFTFLIENFDQVFEDFSDVVAGIDSNLDTDQAPSTPQKTMSLTMF